MAEPDADRKWLPAEWVDEIVPPMLDSPDAYLEQTAAGGWELRLPAECENAEAAADRANPFYRLTVEPGQVADFLACEQFGFRELLVRVDRTFSVDEPVPEKANGFWFPGDVDSMAHTLADFVAGDPDVGRDPVEPGTHTIGVYWWSDRIPFVLELADEKACFRQVAGRN